VDSRLNEDASHRSPTANRDAAADAITGHLLHGMNNLTRDADRLAAVERLLT
jgi:hypothetical protein